MAVWKSKAHTRILLRLNKTYQKSKNVVERSIYKNTILKNISKATY